MSAGAMAFGNSLPPSKLLARLDSLTTLAFGNGETALSTLTASTLTPRLQVLGASLAAAAVAAVLGSTTAANAPQAVLARNKGSTAVAVTAVASGDALGLLSFQGADGTDYAEAVQILSEVDGAVAANQVPGRVRVLTASSAGVLTEGLRMDSAQTLIAGGSASVTGVLGGPARLQVLGTGSNTAAAMVARYSANSSACFLELLKSRGASLGSHGALSSGDGIGTITWTGSDGTNYQIAAQIRGVADAAWSAGSAGGRLSFFVTAAGGVVNSEAMRIASTKQVLFADGTAALPGMSWLTDTSTGLYHPGGSMVGVSCGGTEIARFGATRSLLIGGLGASGRQVGSNTSGVQVESTSSLAGISQVRNSADSGGPVNILGKSRDTAVLGVTAVQSGDTIGDFGWAAADGTDLVTMPARIRCSVDGAVTTSRVPGRIGWFVAAGLADDDIAEVMRLNSSGQLAIGTTTYVGSERLLVSGGSAAAPGSTQVTAGGGVLRAGATTDASSASTGGIITAGGLGAAKNIVGGQGFGAGVTSTATAAGTTTLSSASTLVQVFTGSTTQTITSAAANAFGSGVAQFQIIKNRSTGALTVNRAGSDTIDGQTSIIIGPNEAALLGSNGSSEWEILAGYKFGARTQVTLTDAATIATDASLGDVFTVTLGGNRTLGNPTNPKKGQVILYAVRQDATGSRTLAYDTKFRFGTDVTSPTLTTTAAKTDYLSFRYNDTDDKWDCLSVAKGY